jgi:hypothetical protein
MKKNLLSLSILFSLGASAQLTQANHAPAVGNNYEIFQCDTAGVTGGATGAAATWNFTSVNTTTAAVQKFYTVSAANASYPSADVSVTDSTANTSYFKSSASDLDFYGGDIAFGTISGTLLYTTPAKYATYPMNLNSTITSYPTGSVTALGSTGPIGGTVTVIADGTGTLNLDVPGAAAGTTLKSFTDIVRVKTEETLLGNISLFGGLLTVTIDVKRLNYDYYSPSASKAPLFSIANTNFTLTPAAGTQTVNTIKSVTVQRDYNVVSVIESQKASIQLSVYPNPAATVINFATTSPEATKVIAFDVTGKLVATEVLEMGKAKMNLTNLSSGMYIYHVVDKNNLVLKSDKFNVSK